MAQQRDAGISFVSVAAGLLLMGLAGAMGLAVVTGSAGAMGLLMLPGAPLLLAVGLVVLARGLLPQVPLWRDAPVLCTGLVLLLIGGFPWAYTPYLTGDRSGGEAAGMLGTVLFIFAGLPGLAICIVAGLLRR